MVQSIISASTNKIKYFHYIIMNITNDKTNTIIGFLNHLMFPSSYINTVNYKSPRSIECLSFFLTSLFISYSFTNIYLSHNFFTSWLKIFIKIFLIIFFYYIRKYNIIIIYQFIKYSLLKKESILIKDLWYFSTIIKIVLKIIKINIKNN